jgi:hypothetical protein
MPALQEIAADGLLDPVDGIGLEAAFLRVIVAGGLD